MRFYRRRLPHWRMDGATYFVTWRLESDHLRLSPAERSVVQAALLFADRQRFELLAHVVMDNHVHTVVETHRTEPLERIIHSWRSFTTHALARDHGRTGRLWQREYYDRIIRNEMDLQEKIQYVIGNPWRRWPGTVDYPWVGFRGMEEDLGVG
ncbi:MAG: transposase [Myxococcales bacterium]